MRGAPCICRTSCTGLQRGLPKRWEGHWPILALLLLCEFGPVTESHHAESVLSNNELQTSVMRCYVVGGGYLGTVQSVQTCCMQHEMQKEILYLRPQTSRRYSGQYQRKWLLLYVGFELCSKRFNFAFFVFSHNSLMLQCKDL